MKPIIDHFGDRLAEVDFFNADLTDSNSIEQAVQGCDFVIHTASPVTINNPRNHDDVIGPAVSGVKNVLDAAQKHKIKRVVITSSVSAVEC